MLTAERLRQLLKYDPATGLFEWLAPTSRRVTIGAVAGSLTNRGYLVISVDGRRHGAHRLAFLYMTGSWPSGPLDHRDLDGLNNRWSNLRLASHSLNHANERRRRSNTSGFKSVIWNSQAGKWQARLTLNYRQIHLGYFDDPKLAHNAYVAGARQHFGEFARAG